MADALGTVNLWTPLEDWLRAHTLEGGAVLNEGASDDDLARVESELGVTLPDDFRDAWRAHDGESPGDRTLIRLRHLLPLAAIAAEWRQMNESLAAGAAGRPENVCDAGAGVRAMYWNPRWIPFVLLGGATDFHCLDLDPAEGGRVGQVISVSDDLVRREVVAPDLAQYFDDLARRLRGEPAATAPTPAPAAPPDEPLSGVDLQRFALRMALVVAFWVCAWHALATRSALWGCGAVAIWVVWFVARRRALSSPRPPPRET